MDLRQFWVQRLWRGAVRRLNNLRIEAVARRVAAQAPAPAGRPVAFFKASTGIDDLSWNSAFHLLTSWALRLRGIPVVYFACDSGMSRCVLGTSRANPRKPPPCRSCIYQSRTLYAGIPVLGSDRQHIPQATQVRWFGFGRDPRLARALQACSLEQLVTFEWPSTAGGFETEPASVVEPASVSSMQRDSDPMPLGSMCLPSLRWILRCHNLEDDENTRFLLREYILSAWSVAHEFSRFLDASQPRAVVIFNGQFFPEAVAGHLARRRGLRVITHEVGMRPASAFFTEGEATAYPIRMPEGFELSTAQDARLDAHLEQRFQGRFSMAGIQFWPSMRPLDEAFLAKARNFQQLVPIFTNVIFDTSQPHANVVFSDMFEWLELVLAEIRTRPDTLFVVRAHPDETRLRKESRETVESWVARSGAGTLDNFLFVAPREYLSSYELIQRSKFVMVYNSTIGLEAAILGKPVLCGGRARFTQVPTVFFPRTPQEHRATLRQFLSVAKIPVPPEFQRNARRFLYYQLFRTSLTFGDFLEPSVRTTQARLRSFGLDRLLQSDSIRAVLQGLLEQADFVLPDPDSQRGRSL